MGVTKRLRFEILRRDGYSCRYCGSGENLTVDHVVPTALGGHDEPSNLVTACADCNSGKSATPPDAPLVEDVAQDALRWSRAMRRAAETVAVEAAAHQDTIGDFADLWGQIMPQWAKPLPVTFDDTIEQFIRIGLPWDELEHAVRIASTATHVPQRKRWTYFCGVCWKRVADLQLRAQQILEADDQ